MFRTLTWIRRYGRPGPESILNPPPHVPILDVAARTSFLVLAEEPDREIVLGTLAAAPRGWRLSGKPSPDGFKALFVTTHTRGFAATTMNFSIEDLGTTACTLTTETRVYATDASTRRRFAGYLRVIYPGSALIRRMWLRAIPAGLNRDKDKTLRCVAVLASSLVFLPNYSTNSTNFQLIPQHWREYLEILGAI